MINYLAAAKAAQEQSKSEKRDLYLKLAHQTTPGAEVAVGLAQAELQLSHNQVEHGLATLRHLQTVAPDHVYVLKLLKQIYLQLGDWQSLQELMPAIKKHKLLSKVQYQELQQQLTLGLLSLMEKQTDLAALQLFWKNLTKEVKKEAQITGKYAQLLMKLREQKEAEQVLRNYLKQDWDPTLMKVYGELQEADPEQQLKFAESCLKQHQKDPALLKTLGDLAIRCQLWGKAKDYLQQSIAIKPAPSNYHALGSLLERLNDYDGARNAYRQGLMAAN